MGKTALRCSKCGKMKIQKRNVWDGFQIVKGKPVCDDCVKKKGK